MTTFRDKKKIADKDTTIDLKAQEVVLPTEKVSLQARESKYPQKGSLIWLTGFSGAGKTTICKYLLKKMRGPPHLRTQKVQTKKWIA